MLVTRMTMTITADTAESAIPATMLRTGHMRNSITTQRRTFPYGQRTRKSRVSCATVETPSTIS